MQWCEHYNDPQASTKHDNDLEDKGKPIEKWDQEYIEEVDVHMLFEILLAANYLEIKHLLLLCCKTIAKMIEGSSPEKIRQTFNIKNDWTREEYKKVEEEFQWVI